MGLLSSFSFCENGTTKNSTLVVNVVNRSSQGHVRQIFTKKTDDVVLF
jgi:hypothetical protein